jgi:hypothetical protein
LKLVYIRKSLVVIVFYIINCNIMLDVFIYTICFCKESGPKKYIGTWVVLGEVRVASLFLKDIRDFRYICLGSVSCVECFLYPFFFVLFLFAIVLSVLLRYTDSDCHFGIFKLFLLLVSMLLPWVQLTCFITLISIVYT